MNCLHEKADIQIARMCVEYRNQGVRPVDFDGIADGVIAFHGKDKRFTEPCLRFARALQLDFFLELRPQEVTQKLPNMV